MPLTAARLPVLHRCAPWVLAAWLCVLLVSGIAPWLHGPQAWRGGGLPSAAAQPAPVMERLCSHSDSPQWVPSAFAVPASAHASGHGSAASGGVPSWLHHTLDCALCLPVLAPGAWQGVAAAASMPQALPCRTGAAQCTTAIAALPPARGPPFA